MTALVVCVSISEGNTRQVAEAIGEALGAAVVEPEDIAPNDVAGYDLVGLGSGIYGWMFHARLWRFARSMPRVQGTSAFLFATSGGSELLWRPAVVLLSRLLRSKGYRVVGTFSCRGFDNLGPFQLIGGLNKGRPNEADLAAARAFASGLDKHRKGTGSTRARPAPMSRGAAARPSSSSATGEQAAS
jgi:flavodoxin